MTQGANPFSSCKNSRSILQGRLIRPWEDGKAHEVFYQVMDPFPLNGLSTLHIRYVVEGSLEIEAVIKDMPP